MKTLAELAAIRDKMKEKVALREGSADTRVVVGMATCGIAAGARPVLATFVEEVGREEMAESVTVTQTGCIGLCQLEPIVEVYTPDGAKITYINMTPDRAKRVVAEHIRGGKPVTEYTVGSKTAND